MLRADDVARYFLAHQDVKHCEPISNLKLQKLCYYAQGISLAVLGQPLFHDDIERWEHGPVVPTLYRKYRPHGKQPIPVPQDLDLSLYHPAVKRLLDKVCQDYGHDSAWELRNKTHQEPPWQNSAANCPITHQELRDYFESLPNIHDEFGTLDRETLRRLPEDPQVMKDLKRGIDAMKAGKMVPWDEVKKEFGIP